MHLRNIFSTYHEIKTIDCGLRSKSKCISTWSSMEHHKCQLLFCAFGEHCTQSHLLHRPKTRSINFDVSIFVWKRYASKLSIDEQTVQSIKKESDIKSTSFWSVKTPIYPNEGLTCISYQMKRVTLVISTFPNSIQLYLEFDPP